MANSVIIQRGGIAGPGSDVLQPILDEVTAMYDDFKAVEPGLFRSGTIAARGPTPFQTYNNGLHYYVTDLTPPRLFAYVKSGNRNPVGTVVNVDTWYGYYTPTEIKNLGIDFTGQLQQSNIAGLSDAFVIYDSSSLDAKISDFRARALTTTAPLAVQIDWYAAGALDKIELSWNNYTVTLGGGVRSFRPPVWSTQTNVTMVSDSMGEGKGYEIAAASLNLTMNNVSKYSSGAYQAYRLGTRQLLFTVTGNNIPATAAVAITAINGGPPTFENIDDAFSGRHFLNTTPDDTISTNCSVTGWLGGRHGVVSVPNGGSLSYTFTPDDGQAASTVAAQSLFVPDNLARLARDELWIRMSQNYFYADYTPVFPNNVNPRVFDDIQAIVDRSRGQRIIILALTPGSDMGPATSKTGTALRYFNNQLRVRWPQYAAYLTNVTYNGTSFTGNNMDFIRAYGSDGSANDVADIANGLLPRSCVEDGLHLNAKGQLLERTFLMLYRVAQAMPPALALGTLINAKAFATNARLGTTTVAPASTTVVNSIEAANSLTPTDRTTLTQSANTLLDGPFYYYRRQVMSAAVDQNLVPANITYPDGTRADYMKPEGSTFVNRLTLNEWDFNDTEKYYLGYKQIDYAISGQDLRPVEGRMLDGSLYSIPVASTEWQNVTNEGRVYAGYAEIQFAVVDSNKKIGMAIKLDGTSYDPTKASTPVAVPTAVVCMGDSITAGPYPEALALLSGRTVTKVAIGGQTSRHIVGRVSSVAYRLSLQDNRIISGSNNVTAFNGNAVLGMSPYRAADIQFLSTGSTNASYVATGWLGSVHGTLTRTGTGGPPSTSETYIFVPDAGYPLPLALPPQTPFIVDFNMDNRVIIAWPGRNNYGDTTQVLADFDSIFRRYGEQRLVMMNPLNGDYPQERASSSNPSGYNAFRLIENTLSEKYPRHFLNIRRKIIDLGIGMLNLTPTSQDLIDIADDTTPASLRADGIHPTTACYQGVIAPIVNAHLLERNL